MRVPFVSLFLVCSTISLVSLGFELSISDKTSISRKIESKTSHIPRRSVLDYGAKGDGLTDDTSAIIRAITDQRGDNPSASYPTVYSSSSLTPALIFFPPGVYLIKNTLPLVYYTQLVGDPDNLPTIKMTNTDSDKRMIDALDDRWGGDLVNQNNFFHQVRNFVLDMTECDACTGIHWQVAQATQLSNIHFNMKKNSKCQGIWMENGSGGFISDLVFDGGMYALWIGNQQFTSRNITIRDASIAAIYLNWDWGWTFKSLYIANTPVGIDVGSGAGSLVVIDAMFSNVSVAAVRTGFSSSDTTASNSLVLDNCLVDKTSGSIVANGESIVLAVNKALETTYVASWAQGRVWKGASNDVRTIDLDSEGVAPSRSKLLTQTKATDKLFRANKGLPAGFVENSYFEMPRPAFDSSAFTRVNAVIDLGVANNGVIDVTNSLQDAINKCAKANVVLFLPYGTYLISDTLVLPQGTRILGEAWSMIMVGNDISGTSNFADAAAPKAAIQVGNVGDKGVAQLVDLLITTSGPQPGAKLVEWNMADPEGAPGSAGLWEVHFRIGGAVGTKMDPFVCPQGDGSTAPVENCTGAWALMHITKQATAYMENVWGWVADHDLDYDDQINIYNARGLLVESQGPVWMYGTAFEHSLLYQYNLVGAQHVLMAMIQTETPYFQPAPLTPFPASGYAPLAGHDTDPTFCTGDSRCNMGLGLAVQNASGNIFLYGSGLYSFFYLWDQSCLGQASGSSPTCQLEMTKVSADSKIYMYNFNTYGSVYMQTTAQEYSLAADNMNTFCSTSTVNLNSV